MHARKKRLCSIKRTLESMPVPDTAVDQAFEHFRGTGALPEDLRIARQVIRRALSNEGPRHPQLRPKGCQREYSARVMLLWEATCEHPRWRQAARDVLQREVRNGADPTDRGFLADRDVPDLGGIGIVLQGFYSRHAIPPYVHHANRIVDGLVRLRRRCPQGEAFDPWNAQLAAAADAFAVDGTLPCDPLLREAILLNAEFGTLQQNTAGRDVADILAAFDRLAAADDDEREHALRAVVAFFKNGIPPLGQRSGSKSKGNVYKEKHKDADMIVRSFGFLPDRQLCLQEAGEDLDP